MTLLSPIMFVINVNQFFGRSSPLNKSNVKSETQLLTIFHIPFSLQSPADSWRQSNFDICYSFSDSNVSPFDHSSLITNGWHTKFKILHLVIAHISSFRWQQRSFDASVRRMNRKKGSKMFESLFELFLDCHEISYSCFIIFCCLYIYPLLAWRHIVIMGRVECEGRGTWNFLLYVNFQLLVNSIKEQREIELDGIGTKMEWIEIKLTDIVHEKQVKSWADILQHFKSSILKLHHV